MDESRIDKKEARLFAHLVQQRRATQHFRPDTVPDEAIELALEIARQAPSGYNFQPWRFLVLTDAAQRDKLKQAAFNQEKITEAPVAVIAFGQRQGWKEHVDEIVRQNVERRGLKLDPEQQKRGALDFVNSFDPAVWLNRHVMIAFTHLMLAFEALGWDTAPMEGFDANAVKQAFELPADAEVVALLAVGRSRTGTEAHPGRLEVEQIAFRNCYGEPFTSTASAAAVASR
jgi:nitroreductase